MPRASHDGIEIEYATSGDPDDPALVLVSDLGAQLTEWEEGLIEAFVDRGFHVIRLDNREVGLSSKTERPVDVRATMRSILVGVPTVLPFTLDDMADDVVTVLDDLGIDRAHLFGVSLGATIAQTVAIRHPSRVASLTSVMSTTGELTVGQPRRDVMSFLMTTAPTDREGAVEHGVRFSRIVGSPDHFDEERTRQRLLAAQERCFHPAGAGLQVLALSGAGDRVAGLSALEVPTLVIHGDRDPMVDVSGGERTAALVPGAELLVLEGMGHDLPTYYWPMVVESVTKLAARAAADQE